MLKCLLNEHIGLECIRVLLSLLQKRAHPEYWSTDQLLLTESKLSISCNTQPGKMLKLTAASCRAFLKTPFTKDMIVYIENFKFFLMFTYFWGKRHRMRDCKQGRGRRETQNQSYQHRAWPPGARTYKPWDHDLSQSRILNQPSHPGILTLKTRSLWEKKILTLKSELKDVAYYKVSIQK